MGKARTAAMVLGAGAKVAVKYGPQAKVAWDNGGKKAAQAATRRAKSLTARRKALAQAATVVDGAILKVAPGGVTAYVVLSGDEPVAVHPPQEATLAELVAHADLDKRELPEAPQAAPRSPRALRESVRKRRG